MHTIGNACCRTPPRSHKQLYVSKKVTECLTILSQFWTEIGFCQQNFSGCPQWVVTQYFSSNCGNLHLNWLDEIFSIYRRKYTIFRRILVCTTYSCCVLIWHIEVWYNGWYGRRFTKAFDFNISIHNFFKFFRKGAIFFEKTALVSIIAWC